ncbi:ATP-binding protein [Actinokineospora terrae]|uniref:ATP-binding protein n=1 Tax=Actinokineospora terrae TaxID=155974 RepID=UPI0015A53D09|nr:ATP-binding protein [Actinokineospora terrae]
MAAPVPARLFTLSVPGVPASVAVTRRDLRVWLVGNGVADGLLDDVVLCASEAVTNAIQHGYRDDTGGVVAVSVRVVDTAVVLTVTDDGEWLPAQGGIGVDHGWGLPLIRSLCQTVDLAHAQGRTVLTARLGHR